MKLFFIPIGLIALSLSFFGNAFAGTPCPAALSTADFTQSNIHAWAGLQQTGYAGIDAKISVNKNDPDNFTLTLGNAFSTGILSYSQTVPGVCEKGSAGVEEVLEKPVSVSIFNQTVSFNHLNTVYSGDSLPFSGIKKVKIPKLGKLQFTFWLTLRKMPSLDS